MKSAEPLRAFAQRGALLVVSLALVFLMAELTLRIAGWSEPSFFRVDAERGWSHRPGARGWWGAEGGALVEIDDDGLRGPGHPEKKAAGEFRIAVLGDSFTAAFQVAEEETFAAVIGAELARCDALAGLRPVVLNFGVNNYATGHELITLRRHAVHYEPDLVLLALFTGNDVFGNSLELSGDDRGPFFELQGEKLTVDRSFRDSRRHRFKSSSLGRALDAASGRSRVAQLMRKLLAERGARRARHEALERGREAAVTTAIYGDLPSDAWRDAWRLTERLVVEIRDEASAAGAALLVASLSNPEQVLPDREARERLAAELGVPDLFRPERELDAMAKRHGIAFVPLAPDLARMAEESGRPLHGFDGEGRGHWNPSGHREAGERLAGAICRLVGMSPEARDGELTR